MLAAMAVPAQTAIAAAPKPPVPASPTLTAPGQHLASKSLTPGGTWQWQNPRPTGEPLFAVSCPLSTVCYVAGVGGLVETTANKGATWTVLNAGVTAAITGITCVDPLTCVAIDSAGDAIKTINGGTSWTRVAVSAGIPLFGLACPNDLHSYCFAVGPAGAIFRSPDLGVSWTALTSGVTKDLFSISCYNYLACAAVGASGTIVFTNNTGATWAHPASNVTENLFGVYCQFSPPPGGAYCWAVGANGTLTATGDGGVTWFASKIPGTNPPNLTGVSCFNNCMVTASDGFLYQQPTPAWMPGSVPSGDYKQVEAGNSGSLWAVDCSLFEFARTISTVTTCVAVGDFGAVVATTDKGSGWSPRPAGFNGNLAGITCPSTSTCVAVGVGGFITHTTNGGVTWPIPLTPVSQNLHTVSCPSTTECFAVGNAGTLVGTIDGGATWAVLAPGVSTDLFGISCPSASNCFVVGPGGTIIVTTDAGAHWAAQSSGTTQDIYDVSCPTTTTCFANLYMGGVLLTTNGGATWTTHSLTNAWTDIECPSATTCYLIGQSRMSVTTDGGTTWNPRTLPLEFQSLVDLSCPTTTTCYVTDGSGALTLTTDGGFHWTPQLATGANFGLAGISCPTTTTCIATGPKGVITGTTNGGSTTPWLQMAPLPPSVLTDLKSVSCPSATVCYAAADSSNPTEGLVLATVDGGHDWFGVYSNVNYALQSISCPTTSTCFAVGSSFCGSSCAGVIVSTIDGGVTWNAQAFQNAFIGVNCPTASACYAVTDAFTATSTTNGGTSWSNPSAELAALSRLSCPGVGICFAIGMNSPGTVYKSTDGGLTWPLSFNVAGDPQGGSTAPFRAISCPSATTCYAVGDGGLIATTSDGGGHWRTDFPPAFVDLTAVSCPTTSTCFATDAAGTALTTANWGGRWDEQIAGNSNSAYHSISCPTTSECVAVGNAGAIGETTTGGVGWLLLLPAQTTNAVPGISCPDSNNCAAAAADRILTTHDGGNTWAEHMLTSDNAVTAIACPTASICYAVGWPGAIYRTTDGGSTWESTPNVISGADETLESVSCWSSTSCTAVGTDGQILSTSDGVTWTAQNAYTTQNLFGVSCTSSNSCIAVGGGGAAFVYSAGLWDISPTGTANALASVQCSAPGVCFAVGQLGTVLLTTNQGASWSVESSGVSNFLLGVHCVHVSVCVATGVSGTIIFTEDGKNWSSAPSPTITRLRAVTFLDSGQAWVVGDGGTILANPNLFLPIPPTVTSVSPSAGLPTGGTAVTISGAGFSSGVTGVKFGTTPAASFSVVNDTTITAISPARAVGSVDVTVTTASGTSATSSLDQFTFAFMWYFQWFDMASPGMVGDNIHLFNLGGSTANITVSMPGASPINVALPAGAETHVTFGPGHIGGPVVVSADQQILASQRVQYFQSFNEVWAMTAAQAAMVSYIQWFDRASPGMVGDNIHVLNPGNVSANVTISLPGATPISFALAAGAEQYATFPPGHIGGPVTVSADVPVLASSRVQYYQTFNEVVARSAAQATTTSYFNWFDRATGGMVGDNIHLLNPGGSIAHIMLTLAGAAPINVTLLAGAESYATFPAGHIGGPVTVTSDVAVLASQRVQYFQSFNETPAASSVQAQNVSHIMWFDRASPGMVGDNIHILNPGATTANITVTLPGARALSFSLSAGMETYVNFPVGHIGGPVTITSDQAVLAAQRVQYYQTFNEVPSG
jgi:photosystem II stability/assembly factor-like uncharacterized protein